MTPKIHFHYKDDDTEINMSTTKNSTSEITTQFYHFMMAIGHAPENISHALVMPDDIHEGIGGTD